MNDDLPYPWQDLTDAIYAALCDNPACVDSCTEDCGNAWRLFIAEMTWREEHGLPPPELRPILAWELAGKVLRGESDPNRGD